jgi:hypothetical protein
VIDRGDRPVPVQEAVTDLVGIPVHANHVAAVVDVEGEVSVEPGTSIVVNAPFRSRT